MKDHRILFLVFLYLGTNYGCKKEASTVSTEQNLTTKSISLEDHWWSNIDKSENVLFSSIGRFYYIKGPVLSIDTNYAVSKGNWNWLIGDTLFINHEGVLHGTCVVKKLLQDTLLMDFNVKSNIPITNYIWLK